MVMRITEIVLRELRVPLCHPYQLSKEYGIMYDTTPVTVEIHTDEGIVGWGECDPWPLFTGDSSLSVMVVLQSHLGPALIGQDPTNLNEIHRLMDAIIRGNSIAKSCIDMACWDIFGKAYGLPVHQLLGGKRRDTIRCFWSVGGETPAETAAEVLKIKNEGYWGCMIKIGTANWKNDAARTLAAREAVGPDFPLCADANQGWDLDTAVSYAKAVASADLLFFEQPLQSYDIPGMAKLRRKIDIPVSADEGVASPQNTVDYVRGEAADVFSIKVTKMGGITPSRNICDYAAASGISLFFNSMLEEGITQVSSLNLAATVTNILTTTGHSFFSTLRLKEDITDFYTWIENGITHIPEKPGLGFEINHDALNRYTVRTLSVTQ